MSHHSFAPTSLWSTLSLIDHHCAEQVRLLGCPHCGNRLHRARYQRKPRGISRKVLGERYGWRESFCCASCRRRTTPPSLRFLGRKVYLGALLVLFGNASVGTVPTQALFQTAARGTGIPVRTLQRWRRWWTESIPGTRWWREVRSAFVPPVDLLRLPTALLNRVAGQDQTDRLTRVLALIRPLSTRTCSHMGEGRC